MATPKTQSAGTDSPAAPVTPKRAKAGATAAAASGKAAVKSKPKAAMPVPETAAVTTASRRRKAVTPVTPEQRYRYVEVAAYYIAERRGFAGGSPEADWAAAEAEIERLLAGGYLNQ